MAAWKVLRICHSGRDISLHFGSLKFDLKLTELARKIWYLTFAITKQEVRSASYNIVTKFQINSVLLTVY